MFDKRLNLFSTLQKLQFVQNSLKTNIPKKKTEKKFIRVKERNTKQKLGVCLCSKSADVGFQSEKHVDFHRFAPLEGVSICGDPF